MTIFDNLVMNPIKKHTILGVAAVLVLVGVLPKTLYAGTSLDVSATSLTLTLDRATAVENFTPAIDDVTWPTLGDIEVTLGDNDDPVTKLITSGDRVIYLSTENKNLSTYQTLLASSATDVSAQRKIADIEYVNTFRDTNSGLTVGLSGLVNFSGMGRSNPYDSKISLRAMSYSPHAYNFINGWAGSTDWTSIANADAWLWVPDTTDADSSSGPVAVFRVTDDNSGQAGRRFNLRFKCINMKNIRGGNYQARVKLVSSSQ